MKQSGSHAGELQGGHGGDASSPGQGEQLNNDKRFKESAQDLSYKIQVRQVKLWKAGEVHGGRGGFGWRRWVMFLRESFSHRHGDKS